MVNIVQFPQKPLPWPNDGLRRASVNSFGFGGANAHAILDDASSFLRLHNIQGRHRTESNALERLTLKTAPSERPIISNGTELGQNPLREHPLKPLLFLYSASEESGLQRWATVYKDHLRTSLSCHHEYTYLLDLAYTLSEKRSSLPWKSFVIANSISGVQKGLETELSKPIRSAKVPKVGFIFTGQGAQWYSMGRELFCYTVFEESLEKAEAYFRDLGSDWLLTRKVHILYIMQAADYSKMSFSKTKKLRDLTILTYASLYAQLFRSLLWSYYEIGGSSLQW